MKRITFIMICIILIFLAIFGYIFIKNNNVNRIIRDFYSDEEVDNIVKNRYGSDVVFVKKQKKHFDIEYDWTNEKDRFYKYIYTYKKNNISFNAVSYCATPGFEGRIDYGKRLTTNYFLNYFLDLKKNKFLNDLDYGLADSDYNEEILYVLIKDYSDIKKAAELFEKIRENVSKEEIAFVKLYNKTKDKIFFNGDLNKNEKGDLYYIDEDSIEYAYVDANRDDPSIDEAIKERIKPHSAKIGTNIYLSYDRIKDDYWMPWNNWEYTTSYSGNEPEEIYNFNTNGCNLIKLVGGNVTSVDKNVMKWVIDGDKYEMILNITKNDGKDNELLKTGELKRISNSKFLYGDEILEYSFKKNNKDLDIVVKDPNYSGIMDLYLKDVSKLINREFEVNSTGKITIKK